MEDKRCYVRECTADVEYTCPCSSVAVYACELHAKNHLDKDGKAHSMKSILVMPCKRVREADLEFFEEKNKSKNEKLGLKNLRDKKSKLEIRPIRQTQSKSIK